MGSSPVETLKIFFGLKFAWLNCDYSSDDRISISSVYPQLRLTSFHVSFLSLVKMSSIKWSAHNMWVFIAQLVEHSSANAEAMRSKSRWSPEKFLRAKNLRLQLRWSHLNFKKLNNCVKHIGRVNLFWTHRKENTRRF